MTDRPLPPGSAIYDATFHIGDTLPISEFSATPTDPPMPDQSPCEQIIQRMICDLEIDYCCLIDPTGDPIQDALNAAHLHTVTAQIAILYEALEAIKTIGG